MNNLVKNAWLWFAVWCVVLFFVTQMVMGFAVRWAVGSSAENEVTATDGSGLIELWNKDSYGVTVAKNALQTHAEPVQAVLIPETPILAPGLVRVQ
jgi:hypothetical protein